MPRILLIDGNEMSREMLGRRLQRRGFALYMAASLPAAITLAAREKPDIILIDAAAADMDGLDAVRRIKANLAIAAIPVVALIAQPSAGEGERLIAAGCAETETKPVDLLRLLDKIYACLAPPAPAVETRKWGVR
jgi:two-component system, cell cycle response regulator DivK